MRAAGAEEAASGAIFTFRDGLIVRIQAFFDQDAARREFGGV
jgi:ketosteroid isomerase-like protein